MKLLFSFYYFALLNFCFSSFADIPIDESELKDDEDESANNVEDMIDESDKEELDDSAKQVSECFYPFSSTDTVLRWVHTGIFRRGLSRTLIGADLYFLFHLT